MSEDTPTYSIRMVHQSPWRVGYVPWRDEMMLWRMESDGLFWAFHKGRLDLLCFEEFVQWDNFIDLGEL